MTREEAANQALLTTNGDEGFAYMDDIRVVLAAADAWDQTNGVHRISIEQIQNLARRLMDGDLVESLDVLDTLANGNVSPLTCTVKDEP